MFIFESTTSDMVCLNITWTSWDEGYRKVSNIIVKNVVCRHKFRGRQKNIADIQEHFDSIDHVQPCEMSGWAKWKKKYIRWWHVDRKTAESSCLSDFFRTFATCDQHTHTHTHTNRLLFLLFIRSINMQYIFAYLETIAGLLTIPNCARQWKLAPDTIFTNST